jgi:hypothetical protein
MQLWPFIILEEYISTKNMKTLYSLLPEKDVEDFV